MTGGSLEWSWIEEIYTTPGNYVINLKLTKYCRWKLSGLVCDLGRLELIVITRQFGFLCRQKDVSKYKFVGIEVTETNA